MMTIAPKTEIAKRSEKAGKWAEDALSGHLEAGLKIMNGNTGGVSQTLPRRGLLALIQVSTEHFSAVHAARTPVEKMLTAQEA